MKLSTTLAACTGLGCWAAVVGAQPIVAGTPVPSYIGERATIPLGVQSD